MYEMDRQVNCSNIGEDNIVRNSALVDFLQDCSIFHLDNHPVMSPFFEAENCVMFLVSRQIDIIRKPSYAEKLHIKTWTYDLKRMYGSRNTVIYGENGEPCVVCWAMGVFIDNATKNPRKVPTEMVERVKLYPQLDMEYTSRKISLPKVAPEIHEDIHILKCFIDMNHHVNNARYIDIADEFLPDDADVKRIRIEYKSPLKRGIKASACVYRGDKMLTVDICGSDKTSYCVVEYALA